VLLATLAETTLCPSQRSADDLRRAHIEPYAWVINKSCSPPAPATVPSAAIAGERRQIDRVCGSMAKRVFFVPWQATHQLACLHSRIGASATPSAIEPLSRTLRPLWRVRSFDMPGLNSFEIREKAPHWVETC